MDKKLGNTDFQKYNQIVKAQSQRTLPGIQCTPGYVQWTLQTGQQCHVEPPVWQYTQDNNTLLSYQEGIMLHYCASGVTLHTGQHSTVKLAVQY